jgi:hypothetical protein
MHNNGKNPLPREARVVHFGGTTPFRAQAPKGPAEKSNGSCSFRALLTAATPAMIHRSRELGTDQDSRLIGGPYRPNEDPHPSRVVCYTLARLHRWYQGSELAHRDTGKYQHTLGTADGAVDASDVVTQKQCWPSGRTKWMGPAAMMSEASARKTSPSAQAHSGSGVKCRGDASLKLTVWGVLAGGTSLGLEW